MAIEFIGQRAVTDSTTIQLPVGVTTQPGDVFIVMIACDGGTPTLPSGWTQIGQLRTGGSFDTSVRLGIVQRGASLPNMSWSSTGSANTWVLVIYRGASPDTVDEATSSANSNVAPSVTATAAGQMLIVACFSSDFEGAGVPAGMQVRVQNVAASVYEQELTGAGATGARTFSGASEPVAAWSFILKPDNEPPTADAGPDQTVTEGDLVQLDGSGSTDPEDDPGDLSYVWTVADDGGTGLENGDLVDRLTDSPSFTAPHVDAPAQIVLQLEVEDTGGLTDTDTVTITVNPALANVTGAGGVVLGGAAAVEVRSKVLVDYTGRGGLVVGGQATSQFTAPQVPAGIVVEVDWDRDGDFDEPEENITSRVLALETRTGRDFPSLLTGRVAPGWLRATLNNEDDRFSYFNVGSPLWADGRSLDNSARVRVRTTEATTNPDPTPLSRDRFTTNGGLTNDELGNAWTEPLADGFTVVNGDAVAEGGEGDVSVALVDVGTTEYYAQVRLSEVGAATHGLTGHRLGIVYRWVDSSNYSLAILDVDAGQVQLVDVVGGVELPATSTGGLLLPGVGGSFASTPNTAALQITGDIELTADITPARWDHDSIQYVVAKYSTSGGQRGYALVIETGRTLEMLWSEDGLAAEFLDAAEQLPTSGRKAIRAGLDVDNGSGGHTAHFATADTLDDSFSALGSPQTGSGTTSIHNSTQDLVVGGRNSGQFNMFAGVVHRVQLRDGPGGNIVLDVDFADQEPGTTQFTDSTGFVWTLNGDARIVGPSAAEVEVRDDMTLGVLVSGDQATLYVDGVAVLTRPVLAGTDSTRVGLWAQRGSVTVADFWEVEQPAPALADWHVWAGLPSEVEGVLWTGLVSGLVSSVQPGPAKLARLDARGVIGGTATEVEPPNSVTGRPTGQLVGRTLAMVRMLHPPGPIDAGDLTTGPVAMGRLSALEALRRFETAELGLLYETQEGYIGFASRSARDGATVQATFSDAPGTQLGYHRLEPLDWRREIVNRAEARVAAAVPSGFSRTTAVEEPFNASNPLTFTPPAASPGDLLVILAAAAAPDQGDTVTWHTPNGWVDLSQRPEETTNEEPAALGRVYAKVADLNDFFPQPITLATTDGTDQGSAAVQVLRWTSWFGEVSQGVQVLPSLNIQKPPTILPPWGPKPSTIVAVLFGVGFGAGVSSQDEPLEGPPLGYDRFASNTALGTNGVDDFQPSGVASGLRDIADTLEDPGFFQETASGRLNMGSGTGYTTTIAIRGRDGSPPGSGTIVRKDDLTSQAKHGVRTLRGPVPALFASSADATAWCEEVLARHASDRPVVRLSFYATKSAAYRAQAIRRRVGHKIHLVASHRSGMGIDGDFFIESITHRWSQGRTLWEVTWELSPAD